MYTKFKIDIHATGYHLAELVTMIANHNSKRSRIDLDVIQGYLLGEKARMPDNTPGKIELKSEGENNQTLHVSDNNGESFYLTITECEMYELEEEPQGRAMLFTNTNDNL